MEAPGAPENGAPVSAPASFRRNPGCRLRGLGACAKSLAKHGLEWRVRSTRSNVSCVGAGFRPSFPAPPPALPSTRFGRFAPNPVCRLRENAIRCSRLRAEGGCEKRHNVSRSGPCFRAPRASKPSAARRRKRHFPKTPPARRREHRIAFSRRRQTGFRGNPRPRVDESAAGEPDSGGPERRQSIGH